MKTFFALASLCASASAFAPAANSAVESEYMFLFPYNEHGAVDDVSEGGEASGLKTSLMKCAFPAGG